MEPNITRSVADYLKAIYANTRQKETTSTVELSAYLKVAPSSVTSMLKKLDRHDPPLVDYQKSYGVCLTDAGLQLALRMIRRHRLLEVFLVKVMGYTWEEVHPEAEELEHVISQRFEDAMDHLLGNPDYDPHGDPIPGRDLQMPQINTIPLSKLAQGQTATIRRVHSNESDLLQHLGEQGVRPGASILVQHRNPFDHTIQFTIGESDGSNVIGKDLSEQIYVELID